MYLYKSESESEFETVCGPESMNQMNCYRNRKSISHFVNVCKKKTWCQQSSTTCKQQTRQNTKKYQQKYQKNTNQNTCTKSNVYLLYIYIISIYIYYILLHIHTGLTSLCVCCRPFYLCVCVRLGALCVSLFSLLYHYNTNNNKCYNNIIIYKTRRPINYIYIYILCVYIYLYIYMSNISSMRPTERPTARLPAQLNARPPVWTDRSARLARPPVSPVPKTKQPNNQTKPTMCNVRSIKPLYLWMIPKAPNGKPQKNLYHFISCISLNTNNIPNISYRY